MLTGKTRVVGVIGDPIGHSMSPAIHNAAFKHLGLDFVYVPLHVRGSGLAAAVEGIRALNLVGVNVTIPHKEAVLPLLDEVSPEASLIGAVNTILNRDGKLLGYNTDGKGFVKSLVEEGNCSPRGKTITILGTGGAARAVAVELALEQADCLRVLGRRAEKGEGIRAAVHQAWPPCRVELGTLTEGDIKKALLQSQVLVHATPVGMAPKFDESPLVTRDLLPAGMVVCDLVYNPAQTRLLEEARAAGCRRVTGLGMLIYQGALAFKLWTGREGPVEVMRAVLEEQLEG